MKHWIVLRLESPASQTEPRSSVSDWSNTEKSRSAGVRGFLPVRIAIHFATTEVRPHDFFQLPNAGDIRLVECSYGETAPLLNIA